MREIWFRGKRIDSGEWVVGYFNRTWLSNGEVVTEIRTAERPRYLQEFIIVDPETVGQYTGLTDKKGKKIFAGDIIKTKRFARSKAFVNNRMIKDCEMYVISYSRGAFRLQRRNPHREFFMEGNVKDAKVVGNIYDNPELVREQGK